LKKLGYSADAVANGLEAVEAIGRIPYDIVLMDCQMPELDGYEATRRIRQAEKAAPRPGRPPVYVIAMTANALEGNRESCLAAGMNDFVSKPVRMPELQAVLRRASADPAEPWKPRVASVPSEVGLDEAEEGVIDRGVLNALQALAEPGETGMLEELLGLFLRDAPQRLKGLEAAMTENDDKALREQAHGLKGMASNLGARRLAEACGRLEGIVQAGEGHAMPPVLAQVKEECQRVCELLRRELEAQLPGGQLGSGEA
jgi:CheY-like chemotaxis protein/HPt (histidine-containing phosphotransfer) domain-containing protein